MTKRPKNCTHPECFVCPYSDCIWDGGYKKTKYDVYDDGPKAQTERAQKKHEYYEKNKEKIKKYQIEYKKRKKEKKIEQIQHKKFKK